MKKFKHLIILAAGQSSRFWPLSHKNFFQFLSKPAILHQLESLSNKAESVYIVANDQNKNELEKISKSNFINVAIVVQEGEGMADAVLTVAEKVGDEEALIINSIDFFDENLLDQVSEKAALTGADLVIVSKKIDGYFPGGYIRFENDRVIEIIEKPDPEKKPSNHIKLVVDYFKHLSDFVTVLKQTDITREDRYEAALTNYINNNKVATNVFYDGEWVTLKYPWHVLDATNYFLRKVKPHRGKNAQIADSAIIEGNVYIGDNVKVFEYAKISGPAFIGNGTIIGNYSLIRNSIIGENCLIGGYCEITRSNLGDRVFLHRNYVGDSVLSGGVVMGAEAVLANWRFDQKNISSPVKGNMVDTQRNKLGAILGKNVKIGVNTSVMPGVKIAAGSLVLPQTIVKRDIGD